MTDRALIQMLPGEDPKVVDRAERVLVESGAGIYQRGETLARAVRLDHVVDDDGNGVKRSVGSLVICTVEEPWLNEQFMRYAAWLRPSTERVPLSEAELEAEKGKPGRPRKYATKMGFRPDRPDPAYAKQLLERKGGWRFPVLRGVVETPPFLGDGRILTTPGYDPESRLILDPPSGVEWLDVPERPTPEQVSQAVRDLLEPVDEFPFVNDSYRAAYLSAVLTVIARPAIDGPTPFFASLAPTPATGKTKIVEVVSVISSGHVPAVTTMPGDGDELRKRVTSILLAGSPIVLIDNVSGAVGSDVLDAVATSRRWSDRILGANKNADVEALAVWFISGNNLGFKKTFARRIVPIRLDSGAERPEDRSFKRSDLLGWVAEHRPRLVSAALTILRGYHEAGRPERTTGGAAMGSYEAWDALVRGAVVWAMGSDPADSTDVDSGRGWLRATSDEEHDEATTLVNALAAAFGGEPWTTSMAIGKSSLRQQLDTIAGRGGRDVTPRDLGYKLRSLVDRPFGGLTLRRLPRANGKEETQWRVDGAAREPGQDDAPF